ncbi:hypothetical protein, partial [Pseudomonas silensiensis]|uniref:hypothetical protein n=1 Tax=Pseudomonas silensiensis TaxID=2991049 RepID=UPI003D1F6CA5
LSCRAMTSWSIYSEIMGDIWVAARAHRDGPTLSANGEWSLLFQLNCQFEVLDPVPSMRTDELACCCGIAARMDSFAGRDFYQN